MGTNVPWRSQTVLLYNYTSNKVFKSVSMRKPGRTRQEVIKLKSPILFKLGINVGFRE